MRNFDSIPSSNTGETGEIYQMRITEQEKKKPVKQLLKVESSKFGVSIIRRGIGEFGAAVFLEIDSVSSLCCLIFVFLV